MRAAPPEIVRRVAGLFALADQIEAWLAQARLRVDKLTPPSSPAPSTENCKTKTNNSDAASNQRPDPAGEVRTRCRR